MSIVKEQKKGATQEAAGQKKDRSSNTFEGKVVSITGGKLVMTSKTGKEYSHTLAKDAKISCEGKECKAEELKAGSVVRVTTKKDDRNVAIGIECLDKSDKSDKHGTCCN